jgi:hypothetical protein
MTDPTLFLAFGKVLDPAAAMAREGNRIAAAGQPLGHQVALVSRDVPAFRINTYGWLAASPTLLAALLDRRGLRLLCRDRIEAILPSFAGVQRRWIGGYLDTLDRLFELDDDSDPERLDRPSDRFFAALLPLPAVTIRPVHVDGAAIVPTGQGGPVAADLAFWDGTRLTAVYFGADNTATPGVRAARAALVDKVAPLVTLRRVTTPADADQLAADMAAVARTQPYPCFGPYRADAFQTPLPIGA